MSLDLAEEPLIQAESLDHCPTCGSHQITLWCEGQDRFCQVTQQSFTYSKCRQCGAIFQSIRPIESEIYKFYPDNYVAYRANSADKLDSTFPLIGRTFPEKIVLLVLKALSYQNWWVRRYLPATFKSRFKQLYELPHESATMLDFGCGSGKYLDTAKKEGWHTVGIDFSAYAIDQLAHKGHKGFLMSPNVWSSIEDESIDFVRMNHVLEHLYDPQPVLQELWKKLKPGGCFHMALPNPDSIGAKLFKTRWFSLDCPRHIVLYPPQLIQEMLTDMGFTSFTLLYENLTKDIARSWGYVLVDRGLISHQALDDLIYRKDVQKLLYVPARVATLLKKSDRFHLFFYKPVPRS